jgi:hypothetical protein
MFGTLVVKQIARHFAESRRVVFFNFIFFFLFLLVYSDQPVSSQSPPTRDKLHPEGKAQTRNRNRNRTSQDTTDTGELSHFVSIKIFFSVYGNHSF